MKAFVAFVAVGVAVAMGSSACGAGGGAPARHAGETYDQSENGTWEVPVATTIPETFDAFAMHAMVAGCKVKRTDADVRARCASGLMVLGTRAGHAYVTCERTTDDQCQKRYGEVMSTPVEGQDAGPH